jgi:ABC-type transporter Mla maintaining outer membrane lipid asymmetry ATPase subunit MlaF
VIKHDLDEGTPFKHSDRAKAAISLIGAVSDRHLTWGRGSILSQLTVAENITSSLTEAARAARSALESRRTMDLANFDAVAKAAEGTAKALGVVVASAYKAHLDISALNVHVGGLSLHDGEMPLRQLGLGSKRMLTTGLQKQALRQPHITLCDEVEIALEPHRIARLIDHLKEDPTGQYFVTTHSPVVLRELTVDDLHIVHSHGGITEIVAANKPSIANLIQGKIRTGAEAFLAPKIIVCEGATEAGFVRGLDKYWISKQKRSFAYQGVATFDAHGASKIREISEGLRELHYDVGVLADSDEPNQFSVQDATDLRSKGVTVAMWAGGVSIEERVIADLTWDGVIASFQAARSIHCDDDRLLNQIQTHYGAGLNRQFAAWADEPTLRTAIGKAAKAGDWFKRQSWALIWVNAISAYFDEASVQTSDLRAQVNALRTWVDGA